MGSSNNYAMLGKTFFLLFLDFDHMKKFTLCVLVNVCPRKNIRPKFCLLEKRENFNMHPLFRVYFCGKKKAKHTSNS